MNFPKQINGEVRWLKDNFWKVMGVIFVAGGIAWQVKANTDELSNRRAAIEKIPVLRQQISTIETKLDKILCRLGDTSECK